MKKQSTFKFRRNHNGQWVMKNFDEQTKLELLTPGFISRIIYFFL